jgi:hypothetical protein
MSSHLYNSCNSKILLASSTKVNSFYLYYLIYLLYTPYVRLKSIRKYVDVERNAKDFGCTLNNSKSYFNWSKKNNLDLNDKISTAKEGKTLVSLPQPKLQSENGLAVKIVHKKILIKSSKDDFDEYIKIDPLGQIASNQHTRTPKSVINYQSNLLTSRSPDNRVKNENMKKNKT